MIYIDELSQLIMKRSKYVILLLVSIVSYMVVSQWLGEISPQPQYYTLETKTSTLSSLPPIHQTIGLADLDGILFDGQVVLT